MNTQPINYNAMYGAAPSVTQLAPATQPPQQTQLAIPQQQYIGNLGAVNQAYQGNPLNNNMLFYPQLNNNQNQPQQQQYQLYQAQLNNTNFQQTQ